MLFDAYGVAVTRPGWPLALASVAAALATGFVGSVPAALKAAKLDPVEALR